MDVKQKQHTKKARQGNVTLAKERYTIHTTVRDTSGATVLKQNYAN